MSSGDSEPKFAAVRPPISRDLSSELLAQFSSLQRTLGAINERCARMEQQLSQQGRVADDVAELREWFAAEIRRVETEAREARERATADLVAKLATEHDKVLTLRAQAIGVATLVAFVVPLAMHFVR